MTTLRLLLVVLGLTATVTGKPSADKITDLPGLDLTLGFDQYAGYLDGGSNADSSKNHIFYFLTEYQKADNEDVPILLWLNGGPGCSSLGGLMTELGPLRPNADGKTLQENVYAWNKLGHVVHFESPPGVGFSYADNGNQLWDDDTTSDINVHALNDFFLKYPEFAKRKFFITGESYAGVYLPTLAQRIKDWTIEGNFSNPNFQGMAIGNGELDEKVLYNAVLNYYYGHGILGDKVWNAAKTACCGGINGNGETCDFYTALYNATDVLEPDTSACANASYIAIMSQSGIPDPYNIYQSCWTMQHINALAEQSFLGLRRIMSQHFEDYQVDEFIAKLSMRTRPNYDSSDALNGLPCYVDNANAQYLNTPRVQKAIHVDAKLMNDKSFVWADCNNYMNIHYNRTYLDVKEQFNYVLQPFSVPNDPNQRQLRVMTYNGDVDIVCNFLGDQWFGHGIVEHNNLATLQNHSVWMYDGVLAGFVERFDNLDIMTVNGAGHFVPMDRAGPALQMIANFIWGTGNYTKPSGIDVTPRVKNVIDHPDKIKSLPGLPYTPPFDMYAGYLNGGQTLDGATNNLFYWFNKYQMPDNVDVPVILWLNGGPGCSSLGGLFTENGPFYPNKDGQTLFENVYSWNKVGHVIYMESPPGVGFSYNDNWHESWNDDEVAMMNALALQDFFTQKFPEYVGRTFYITGESYGGVYIPTLSKQIVQMIKAGTFNNTNFAGFAIGNGCTDDADNFNGLINTAYYHGFIGQYQWLEMKRECCPMTENMSAKMCNFAFENTTATCNALLDNAVNKLYGVLPDPYNMYQSCYQKNTLNKMMTQQLLNNGGSTDHLGGFACFGDKANQIYLQRPDVQEAINVSPKWMQKMKNKWYDCTLDSSPFNYTKLYADQHAQFDYLLQPFTPQMHVRAQSLRIMMYNGDVDYVCNFLGDEWLVAGMDYKMEFAHDVVADNNLMETMERQNWVYSYNLAGTQQSYRSPTKRSTYDVLTVNGAGHFVPMDRPGASLQMLYNFIQNTGNYSLPAPIDIRPVLYDPYTTLSECPTTPAATTQKSTTSLTVSLLFTATIVMITTFGF